MVFWKKLWNKSQVLQVLTPHTYVLEGKENQHKESEIILKSPLGPKTSIIFLTIFHEDKCEVSIFPWQELLMSAQRGTWIYSKNGKVMDKRNLV